MGLEQASPFHLAPCPSWNIWVGRVKNLHKPVFLVRCLPVGERREGRVCVRVVGTGCRLGGPT